MLEAGATFNLSPEIAFSSSENLKGFPVTPGNVPLRDKFDATLRPPA